MQPNKMSLLVLAKICDPFSVSDCPRASISFAVLKDNRTIDEQNKELTIARSKVKRQRKKDRRNHMRR